MAQTQVYVEDPFDRIVNVHWGGGAVVVAEVPHRLAYLLSLDPADPADGVIGDEQLTFSGTYNENLVIPVDDYTTMPLDTTANIYMGTPIIDGIADTALLVVGTVYKITGTGIAASTTMTYGGGGAGVLSNNGTLDIAGASVEIRIRIWEYKVSVDMAHTGLRVAQAQFRAEVEAGDSSYFASPFMLAQIPFTGQSDADMAAALDVQYANLLAAGYPAYALYKYYRTGLPDSIHNGVHLVPFSIWQFVLIMAESSDVFLINMGFTKLVQVNQLVYEALGNPGNYFVPGYLPGGTKLTAYASGTQFSLSATAIVLGGWGNYYSLIVKAKTGATDPETGLPIDAVPLWTATVPPMEVPPADTTQIARFNASGLA